MGFDTIEINLVLYQSEHEPQWKWGSKQSFWTWAFLNLKWQRQLEFDTKDKAKSCLKQFLIKSFEAESRGGSENVTSDKAVINSFLPYNQNSSSKKAFNIEVTSMCNSNVGKFFRLAPFFIGRP